VRFSGLRVMTRQSQRPRLRTVITAFGARSQTRDCTPGNRNPDVTPQRINKSAVQDGSGSIAGLSSLSASWIACQAARSPNSFRSDARDAACGDCIPRDDVGRFPQQPATARRRVVDTASCGGP
jgi:hypothetical protein